MAETSNTRDTIIAKAFENWADKTWFQVLAVILIVYLMVAPIIGPIIYNTINKQNTSEAVVQSLDERDKQIKEEHKLQFERAKQTYALAKNTLKEYLETTGSDYIFLFEFHNGVENVMSGIQFCRFDLTLEVAKDNVPYVPSEKFKDDIVARYDILLDPNFESSARAFYYDIDEVKHVDRYLEQQLLYLDAKSCALINIANDSGIIVGTLVFVNCKKNAINITEVYKCQREIENIFKK